jgi:CHASE3 domain sensor protein
MANYQSDITRFLQDYKQAHPDTEQRQRDGRGLLWDRPQDPELLEQFRAARVQQRPYVYQND